MKIEITIKDYQIIRQALMKRPAEEVYSLIAQLDDQVVADSKGLENKEIKMAEAK